MLITVKAVKVISKLVHGSLEALFLRIYVGAAFTFCDVSKESDVKLAVDMAVDKSGKLDIMINTIGDEAKLSIVDMQSPQCF